MRERQNWKYIYTLYIYLIFKYIENFTSIVPDTYKWPATLHRKVHFYPAARESKQKPTPFRANSKNRWGVCWAPFRNANPLVLQYRGWFVSGEQYFAFHCPWTFQKSFRKANNISENVPENAIEPFRLLVKLVINTCYWLK